MFSLAKKISLSYLHQPMSKDMKHQGKIRKGSTMPVYKIAVIQNKERSILGGKQAGWAGKVFLIPGTGMAQPVTEIFEREWELYESSVIYVSNYVSNCCVMLHISNWIWHFLLPNLTKSSFLLDLPQLVSISIACRRADLAMVSHTFTFFGSFEGCQE